MGKMPRGRPLPANQLVLEFRNQAAFRAKDLSDLFGALARDYRSVSRGRDLVVAELHTGSLLATLRDAVEFMASINTIVDFGKLISDTIELARRAPNLIFNDQTKSVTHTVEKLLDTAVHSNSEVKLRYEGRNGEKLLAHVKPTEAETLSIAIRRSKKQNQKRLSANKKFALPTDRDSIIRAIGENRHDHELLKTIARILLRQGMLKIVESVATELRRLGRNDEAEVLIEEIRAGRGSIEDRAD